MKFLFALLCFCSGFIATAQSSKLHLGIASYEMGDYETAVEHLNEAMKNTSALKSKEIPLGWYHLGKSKSKLISTAMSLQAHDQLIKYKGYDLDAYDCFKKALASEPKSDLEETIKDEISLISYVIFNSGNMEYLLGQNTAALSYYNTVEEIADSYGMRGDYQIYSLRGQTYLAMADSSKAYIDFTKAIQRYQANPPEIPDANIGYAFYSMAIIDRYNNDDVDKALELVQEGTEMVQSESDRLNGLMNSASSDKRVLAAQQDQFASILDALNRFELDIYNNSPKKYDEAVAKFEKAIKENPTDVTMRIIYGNLIEQKDPDTAYEVYKKAIELDPNNDVAQFNAGANRVNKGVEYARKANEEFDFEKANAWQEKVNEQFGIALPHLEKAHELDPENIYILDALLQVTMQLEMMEAYKMYKEKSNKLRGY